MYSKTGVWLVFYPHAYMLTENCSNIDMLNRHLTYLLLLLLLLQCQPLLAGSNGTDRWEEVLKNGKGTITILWCEIEPFIYHRQGQLIGVEYELMETFPKFLKATYNVEVDIIWTEIKDFEQIYPQIKTTEQTGLFAASYYSITPERKREVQLSPPYMPDVNVLVSSNDIPVFTEEVAFFSQLKYMKGFTMGQTTMEADMVRLQAIVPGFQVVRLKDDYEVMRRIARTQQAIGYIPLSIYVVGLQKGIKMKRQQILPSKRAGFAVIYPMSSDWTKPVNAYFESALCQQTVRKLIAKHLGPEIAGIVQGLNLPDSMKHIRSDLELLTKEREIVTGRFVDSALEVQRVKIYRNISIAGALVFLIIILILLNRFATKKKYVQLLQQTNEQVLLKNTEIEWINMKLQRKLILAQLNPHLIFNTLTAVQHFVLLADKKAANKYLSQLSRFVRQMLLNSEKTMVSVDKEAGMIQQYLSLEQARFDHKFDFDIEVSTESRQLEIPSMMVFPFVEEALYTRVLRNKRVEQRSQISVVFHSDELCLSVGIRDNAGLDALNAIEMEAIARSARLAREQIELFNKNSTLKIKMEEHEVLPNGYTLVLTIPLAIII